jgi:biopolymer transport protein ExbD
MDADAGAGASLDERPFESMNMIPFIDIMLVLLTIVLTTSSFIVSGKIPVHLPQAESGAPDQEKSRTVEIDARGQVFFEGEPVTMAALRAEIAPLPRDTPFLVRADREVRLQGFVDVADALKQSGFSKVAVETTQSGAP